MIITNENIKEKYQDMANMWRVLLDIGETSLLSLKFNHNPTLQELQILVDNFENQHQYDNIAYLPISIYDAKTSIENAIIFIKTTPSLNLTKWNTYISTLNMEDGYAIKWFIFVMARKLSEKNDIVLDNFTELEILGKMKTWFINTPERKIKKIFYGE